MCSEDTAVVLILFRKPLQTQDSLSTQMLTLTLKPETVSTKMYILNYIYFWNNILNECYYATVI